jgi:Flp pilus assembly pilin Flp
MVHKVHYSKEIGPPMTIAVSQDTREETKTMKQLLLRLWKEEEGQDLTEYALLLVLLTLAAIGSLSQLATAINGVFSKAITNLT